MGTVTAKIYTPLLTFSIVGLSWALVWFAFIYYPKVLDDYKSGRVLPAKPIIRPVSAASLNLPIETEFFRIVWEDGSNTHYVFIEGRGLADYLANRDAARLALKTALSAASLCDVNVIYVSTAKLTIPQNFQDPNGC